MNILMRNGIKQKIYKLFTRTSLVLYKESFTKQNSFFFKYLFLNNFLKIFFSEKNNNWGQRTSYSNLFNFFLNKFLLKQLPIFSFSIVKVDKKIRKYSRGK